VAAAESDTIKAQLRRNGERALELGLCGVPSFVIQGQKLGNGVDNVLWGQDRMDVLMDLLSGWEPKSTAIESSGSTNERSQL
jgi:2-hydroxychromene-2-carboxylate isomerase